MIARSKSRRHRPDRGDEERRLQRALAQHHRPADRPAVPGQRHSAGSHQPAGSCAAQCLPAADSRIPAGREQLDRQPVGLQQPAEGQHQDRLGAHVQSSCRGAPHLGAERLERSRADGRVLDDLGLPGAHDGGDADEHALQLADQRVLVLVGLDQPVEVLRAAQLRLLSRAAPTPSCIRRTASVGINYPYLFPGTKLDPDKIPNISLQGFTAINNAAYPGSWNDFVFLWADNVTKITGNHAFKAGISIERSGMNDRIQLSFAQAPATTNQNGSFRFIGRATGSGATTGYSVSNAAARALRRLHRVRQQAEHEVAGHGLRLLRAGQLEADARSDARARSQILAVAAVGRDETARWRRSSRSSTTRRPRR